MSTMREGKNTKNKTVIEAKAISWQERKCLADQEEDTLHKDIQRLTAWVCFKLFNSFGMYVNVCM